MSKEIAAARAKLVSEWNISEEYLKISEQISAEAVIPGINELRYAGRKLLDAYELETADPKRALTLLNDAVHDCYRARHDCIDVAVSLINSHVELMTKKLTYTKMTGVLPDLGSLISDLSSAQTKMAGSRARRSAREEIYEDIKDIDLPAIRVRYDKLRASEGLLKLEVVKENRSKVLAWTSGAVGILVAFASLIATILD
ncbi:MAG: hypothetical protein ACRCU5_12340 [Rhizobiaceae bacterium]